MPGPSYRYRMPDREIRKFAEEVWRNSGRRGSSRRLYKALKRSGEPKLVPRRRGR